MNKAMPAISWLPGGRVLRIKSVRLQYRLQAKETEIWASAMEFAIPHDGLRNEKDTRDINSKLTIKSLPGTLSRIMNLVFEYLTETYFDICIKYIK